MTFCWTWWFLASHPPKTMPLLFLKRCNILSKALLKKLGGVRVGHIWTIYSFFALICVIYWLHYQLNLDAEGTELWTCMCSTDGFPKVVADNRDSNCFTSCNCTYDIHQSFNFVVWLFLVHVYLNSFTICH